MAIKVTTDATHNSTVVCWHNNVYLPGTTINDTETKVSGDIDKLSCGVDRYSARVKINREVSDLFINLIEENVELVNTNILINNYNNKVFHVYSMAKYCKWDLLTLTAE